MTTYVRKTWLEPGRGIRTEEIDEKDIYKPMTEPTIAEMQDWVLEGYDSDPNTADAILRILREADMPTRRALDEACARWVTESDQFVEPHLALLHAAVAHGNALREIGREGVE